MKMQRRTFFQTTLALSPLVFHGFSMPVIDNSSEVINSGVSGNNTIDLLARFEKDCLAHQPDLTILMVGTNDMNSRKFVPLPDYEHNMRTMIEQILKIKSRILLLPLLPVYEPYLLTRHKPEFYQPEGHAGRKKVMNNLIQQLASEYKLSFLNLHHIFEKIGNVGLDASSFIKNEANSQKTDGLHPTSAGYKAMAIAIYQYITDQNLPHKKVVCFGDSITIGDGDQNYPTFLKSLLNS